MRKDPKEVNTNMDNSSYDDTERYNYSSGVTDEWDDHQTIGTFVDE